jgi:hypothetical protein
VDDIGGTEYMLTIQNITKLNGTPLVDGWEIIQVFEGNHNDTYIFELINDDDWSFQRKTCKIMLERTGHKVFGQPGLSYFFIYNSMRTNVSVSADYIADKDNMVDQLEYILMNKEKL